VLRALAGVKRMAPLASSLIIVANECDRARFTAKGSTLAGCLAGEAVCLRSARYGR